MKNELIKKIETHTTVSPTIRFSPFQGYSYTHIDLFYKEEPILHMSVEENCPGKFVLKLINPDELFKESETDIILLKEIRALCRDVGISEVYGKVNIIKSQKQSKEFYEKNKFDFVPIADRKVKKGVISIKF